jgi:succinate dehydrogenase hydrophobic anchor subunit
MDVIYKQKKNEVVINLIEKINYTITKIKTKLFIATAAYDKYYKRYYIITLTLFILSSVVTFIEALRLIIMEYVNKDEQLLINVNLLTTLINVLVLFFGIIITILSSYIRFKNYREILEELREKQNIMIEYIDKYKKQKNNLEYIYQIKEDDIKFEEIEKIKNDIEEYDTKIESTNIQEYITTKDIIRFNNYKGDFDLKIIEIKLKYKKESKIIEEKYEEKPNIMNLQKDNNPYIIVQYEPNKSIQPQLLHNHFIQPINQPIKSQPINQPIQYIQPIQPINQPIQSIQSIQSKNNIKSNKPLDLSRSTNKFYNLS